MKGLLIAAGILAIVYACNWFFLRVQRFVSERRMFALWEARLPVCRTCGRHVLVGGTQLLEDAPHFRCCGSRQPIYPLAR